MTPNNYSVELKLGNGIGDTSTAHSYVCVRGTGYWCGESCVDGVKNQDETDVDFGGICGTCDDGIMNFNETDIDYGGRCGDCYNSEKDYRILVNGTYYLIANPETGIDLGGRCGSCDNGAQDRLTGETMIDYGGRCGTCYDGLLSPLLNETDMDYGGHWCGSCKDGVAKADDKSWFLVKEMDMSLPFNQDKCKDIDGVVGFLFWFIIVILGVGVLFILVYLFGILLTVIGFVGTVYKGAQYLLGSDKAKKFVQKYRKKQ
jgi:hypothetical protein